LSRSQPVLELTQRFEQKDERVRQLADVLQRSSGKLTPILDTTLLHSTGLIVGAGATTTIEGTYTSLDFLDANIDTVRLLVRGKTAAAGPITLQLYDVTNSVVLATATVTTVNGTNVGAWTSVAAKAGERELAIRVVGDGVNAQTIYAIHAQLLTTRFLS
jgi:hypothetical protein